MKKKLSDLLIFCCLLLSFNSYSQRGKDGNYTVTTTNAVVNAYTTATLDINVNATTIAVQSNALSVALPGGPTLPNLAAGDLVLIMQMQGASMDVNTGPVTNWGGTYTVPTAWWTSAVPWSTQPWLWGQLTAYNNCGKYEFAEVLSVTGTTSITFRCGLKNAYTAAGKVQVIRVPRFSNLTINASQSIAPITWGGQTGGVVAVEVDGNLVFQTGGRITASARGFRGAVADNVGTMGSTTLHTNGAGNGGTQVGSSQQNEGGRKGEGVSGYTAEYDALSSRYGRGAPANGGGGAGYQNSGGGGGSNVGLQTGHTGKGIPAAAFNAIWNLELAGFGGTNSPGGGRGGYSLAALDANETATGPNNASWGGDARKENGGLGGHPLAYDATRAFMGGGGGAGDQDSGQGGSGGNGGGIVFVTCYGTISGTGSIEADGAVGLNSNPNNQTPPFGGKRGNDGAGGGGGGGAIIIQGAAAVPGTISLLARGGAGGNMALSLGVGATAEASGPGGGGGGGMICAPTGTTGQNVNGGASGVVTVSGGTNIVSNFTPNGATGGSAGIASNPSTFFNIIPNNQTICASSAVTLTVTVVGTAPGTITWYTQQFGGTVLTTGTSYTTPVLSTTTTYYVGVCPGTFRIPITVTITPSVTPTFNPITPVCSGGSITLPATSLQGITGTWSPAVNNTQTTTYTFTPAAGQCATTATLSVTVNPPTTPTFDPIAPICSGGSITLPASSLQGITGTWSPAVNNTVTTNYTFTPAAGQCATTALLTVAVGSPVTPTFTAVPPICSGESFSLPATSTEGFTGTWSPAINNTSTTNYTFTPTVGQCATTASLSVTVNLPSTPTFDPASPICSGGSITLPSASLQGFTGTWSPAINNTSTTTYTFTPTAGQCATTGNLSVTVNQPITPSFAAIAPICSGGSINLPAASQEGIGGTWSPAINNTNTTNYTFTPTTGQCANNGSLTVTVNQPVTPSFAAIAPICNGGTIVLPAASLEGIGGTWSPAVNNTVTTNYSFTPSVGQCATTGALTVTVNQPVTPTFAAIAPVCSGGTVTLPASSQQGISGTWSPAINNTATTNYLFTPTAGQCANTGSLTVVIGSPVTPTFNPINPICNGGSFTLVTTSNEGFTGSWSPAINNTATTNYTFTPSAGQCATTANLSVTVNQPITPSFASIAPICSGGSINLPVSSQQGISGTWSPVVNNTATTNYTFTPTAGQCATTASLSVTVNQPTIPIFAAISPICSGSSLTLPASSQQGITGTWSPAVNNTATTNYTFTPAVGQCATTNTLTVTVNQPITPTFTQWGPYCEDAIIAQVMLPSSSNEGINGTWNPGMVSTANAGNIVHTFTPSNGQCANTATMTVVVNPNVTPTFSQIAPICVGDPLVLPISSLENINGSWLPAINNTATTTYTFTPTTGQCVTSSQMTVAVGNPVTPTFSPIPQICIGGSLTLPSSSIENFTGTWSPAINNTVTTTYTFTPTAGQCATTGQLTVAVGNPITPTFAVIAPVCEGGAINLPVQSIEGYTGSWSPAPNNTITTTYSFSPTAGQCASNTTLTVTIVAPILPTFNISTDLCEGQNLLFPSTSGEGISGTWSPAFDNTNSSTYTFTPVVGACATPATQDVTIHPNPTIDLVQMVLGAEHCGQGDGTIQGITVSSGSPGYTYLWNNTPSLNTLDLTSLTAGNYTLVVTDAQNCSASESIALEELGGPQVDTSKMFITPVSCVSGGAIQGITANGSNPFSVTWAGTAQTSFDVTNLTAGDYVLTVEDAFGCTTTLGAITLNPPSGPTAAFSWTPENPNVNDQVNFDNNSLGNIVTNEWIIEGNNYSTQNATYSFGQEGGYIVTLIVTDQLGCIDTVSQEVVIFTEIIIPNVLTANGDGVNDSFEIANLKPNTYVLIVNRWGDVVWETDSYLNDWKGFDQSGTALKDGVYTYLVKTPDGEKKHGFVHLVR